MIKLLFIGDIVGKLGRETVKALLPQIKEQYQPDFVLANGENSAHGYSITEKVYKELMELGIDAITMGNHMWDKKELAKDIEKLPMMARPANFPNGVPGKAYLILEKNRIKIAILNLLGRTFMHPLDCPFQAADKYLPILEKETRIIIVDMHAEATSEKLGLAYYLDGRASLVLGTHTHVMTADERILPQGTGFITDIGMVGAKDSIIGMNKDQILKRFVTQMHDKFEPMDQGPAFLNAIYVEIDPDSAKCVRIVRIQE